MPNLEKSTRLRETEVVSAWQRQVLSRRRFTDLDGARVEVLYPGRPNDCRGADFKEALITWDGKIWRGSIEIHTRVTAWKDHSHQRDPVYNDVVLHVVWQKDSLEPVRRQDGGMIPTIVLSDLPLKTAGPPSGISNCGLSLDKAAHILVGELLGGLGDLRFESKARSLGLDSPAADPAEVLYRGLMEALGYSQNKPAFRVLAENMPLRVLQERWLSPGTRFALRSLESALLGQAGFLSSPLPGPPAGRACITRLEKTWQALGPPVQAERPQWEVFKIRPANHPVRRIIAISYLIWRYRRRGLVFSLLNLLKGAGRPGIYRRLQAALMVKARGHWLDHFDCGFHLIRPIPHLLGESRASEMIVNVLLPFALAFAEAGGDPELERRARQVFAGFPKLESNSLERHLLSQLGLGRSFLRSARQQLGLIHLYRNYCLEAACRRCPLSAAKIRV